MKKNVQIEACKVVTDNNIRIKNMDLGFTQVNISREQGYTFIAKTTGNQIPKRQFRSEFSLRST